MDPSHLFWFDPSGANGRQISSKNGSRPGARKTVTRRDGRICTDPSAKRLGNMPDITLVALLGLITNSLRLNGSI